MTLDDVTFGPSADHAMPAAIRSGRPAVVPALRHADLKALFAHWQAGDGAGGPAVVGVWDAGDLAKWQANLFVAVVHGGPGRSTRLRISYCGRSLAPVVWAFAGDADQPSGDPTNRDVEITDAAGPLVGAARQAWAEERPIACRQSVLVGRIAVPWEFLVLPLGALDPDEAGTRQLIAAGYPLVHGNVS